MSTTTLTGSNSKIEISPNYYLEAPGLKGELTVLAPSTATLRSGRGLYEEQLLLALTNQKMFMPRIFELNVTDIAPIAGPGATRSDALPIQTSYNEPAIRFSMPRQQKNAAHALLYTDETGVSRWIFPTTAANQDDQTISFHLPYTHEPPPPSSEPATRGKISKIGRRLIRAIAWASDIVVGAAAEQLATKWELQNHPYRWLQLHNNHFSPTIDWAHLQSGPALLLLHGTFSSAEACFGQLLSTPELAQLVQQYNGRIFAFNHPTLHTQPANNIETLFQMLPADCSLAVDLITHSRGGLVARELIERTASLNHSTNNLSINKAIFVAAPNQGTILTDGDNWYNLIDRYTNFITSLPDNLYTLSLEGVLTAVKLLGTGALKGLPGVQSMLPNGPYLQRLNNNPPTSTIYHAISANFTPQDPNLIRLIGKKVGDKIIDTIFGEENDGVVPTAGSFNALPTTAGFPIPPERQRIFSLDDQLHHCNYFSHQPVRQQLQDWLAGSA